MVTDESDPELCDEPLDVEESSSPDDDPVVVEASLDVELPVVVEPLAREVLACCVALVDAAELEPR